MRLRNLAVMPFAQRLMKALQRGLKRRLIAECGQAARGDVQRVARLFRQDAQRMQALRRNLAARREIDDFQHLLREPRMNFARRGILRKRVNRPENAPTLRLPVFLEREKFGKRRKLPAGKLFLVFQPVVICMRKPADFPRLKAAKLLLHVEIAQIGGRFEELARGAEINPRRKRLRRKPFDEPEQRAKLLDVHAEIVQRVRVVIFHRPNAALLNALRQRDVILLKMLLKRHVDMCID